MAKKIKNDDYIVPLKLISMKYIFFTAALFFTSMSYAQTSIKLEDVSKHVGDSVTVCGKVAGGRFLEQLENSPTFLNLGGAYPNQLLTVVIGKELRANYDPVPETQFMDKEICVTGKIVIMRDRPQILIYSKDQIKVSGK